MELRELYTDSLLWIIFTTFNIYTKIGTIVLRTFFPLTKYIVDKKLKTFGIEVNGNRPTDISVINEHKFYTRLALEGTFGLFEGRMDRDWTTKDFAGLVQLFFSTRRHSEAQHPLTWTLKFFNLQTKARVWQVGEQHYDVGNDIIESMLDKNLQYTCGYWRNADNLDDAQLDKMELIAKKLQLKPGMTVLDIGCGYGTLGYHLAKNYGVQVVGCSVSKEQTKYAQDLCKGLPCEFIICDYRDLTGNFDRVVSVGMFEHVGGKNYREFFEVCNRCLKDEGILLLHTIGNNHKKIIARDTWIHKYIFPNGYVPYYLEICNAMEGLWIIEDWHNFGFDYTKTLAAWENNFDKAWPKFESKYGDRFYLMWKTYLQASRGCFASRAIQLWQIVLTKDGLKGGYQAAR